MNSDDIGVAVKEEEQERTILNDAQTDIQNTKHTETSSNEDSDGIRPMNKHNEESSNNNILNSKNSLKEETEINLSSDTGAETSIKTKSNNNSIEKKTDIDPIPFRRLSPESMKLLNKPVPRSLNTSLTDFQFSKIIGIILKARGMHYSQEFLTQITDLSIMYFHDLIDCLRKFTEVQRRRKPSISDTTTCLRVKGIKPYQLFDEFHVMNKKITPELREQINIINNQTIKHLTNLEKFDGTLAENDTSLPFFANEHYEITELVPKQAKKPSYIPSFLPDLPPDYTYQITPKYVDTLTDLKQLRLKLVEESRLTEKSLYNLIEDDENQWRKNLELELNENIDIDIDETDNENSIMSDSGFGEKNIHTDAETPIPESQWEKQEPENYAKDLLAERTQQKNEQQLQNSENKQKEEISAESVENKKLVKFPAETKAFDFIAYAKKMLEVRKKKDAEIERNRSLRESNIFMKAEKYYSPYATLPVIPEVEDYFKKLLKEEFKAVIASVRIAEKKKKRKIARILKEKARKEREKEKELDKLEFGFNFDHINHSSDEESEDNTNNHGMFPEFDFGDNVKDVSDNNNLVDVVEHHVPRSKSESTNTVAQGTTQSQSDQFPASNVIINNAPKEMTTQNLPQKISPSPIAATHELTPTLENSVAADTTGHDIHESDEDEIEFEDV